MMKGGLIICYPYFILVAPVAVVLTYGIRTEFYAR